MTSTFWRRVIGWSEVLGGTAGYGLLALTAVQQPQLGIPDAMRMPDLWYIMGAVVFGSTIAAGIMLVRDHPNGVTASIVVQAAQLLQFSLPGRFVYQFATGVQILLFVNPYEVRLSPGVNASFTALPPRVAEPWSIGLNLFAILALVILVRARRSVRAAPSASSVVDVAAG